MLSGQEPASSSQYDDVAGSDDVGPFVLDLCSMPGPIAIPQPRSELLNKFSFFVSRRDEAGRDSYWLCMGYFPTRAEAQKWLQLMRRVYPSAWVTQADVTFSPAGAE